MSFLSLEEMIAASAGGIRPPERLTVAQAAERYRHLNNPGSYVGYWDNTLAPYLVEPMEVLTSQDYIGMIFAGPARTGKALPLSTPIPSPSGWTTMGDLQPGDAVFGRDGKVCRVVAATDVMYGHDCYRLTFDDGTHIEADAGHKWYVETKDNGKAVKTTEQLTSDYLARSSAGSGVRSRYAIPVAGAIQTPDADLPIPPYTLGIWLGDGNVQSAALDLFANDADEITGVIRSEGCTPSERSSYKENTRDFTVRLPDGSSLCSALKRLGFIGVGKGLCRKIPPMYFRASEGQRRQLLRGLMDTDGTVSKGSRSCEFASSSPGLVYGVRDLLVSLGYKVNVRWKFPTYRYKGEKRTGRAAYTVQFFVQDGREAFNVSRYHKAISDAPHRPTQTTRRWITKIDSIPSVPVRCIQVDSPDSLFLAGGQMVPTHNSDMFFNWLTHTAICDPADMMHVLMTQSVARDWSQKDLRRAFRHSTKLGETVAPGRHNQSTHSIRFLSGMHVLVKWPTITELSGKTVGRNWISDYDRIPESIDGEGNAYDLTAKRGQTFRRNAMTVAESSPGFDIEDPKWMAKTPHEAPPTKGILALYNRGDRRFWYWRCPHCAEAFEPHFKHLRWPDSNDHVEAAEAAFMACPKCGGVIYHDSRHGIPGKHELNQITEGNATWVRDGQLWIPKQHAYEKGGGTIEGKPFRSDIASFWLKGPAASFTTWRELVLKYLKAEDEYERTGSQEALKTTVNTDQGMPFTPKGLETGRMPEDVKATAKDFGVQVVPEGVRFLEATIDVQASRFEVQVMGFSEGGDITVIDRFAIKKSARLDEDGERERVRPASYVEDWKLLIDQVILKTYPLGDGSGRRMAIKMTGCDSGGMSDKKNDSSVTKNAYEFYRMLRDSDGSEFPKNLHRQFQLLKGGSNKTAPRVQLTHPDSERKDRSAGARGEIPVLILNTMALKDQLNVMMDRKVPGGGMIRFPDWLPDWFWHEICAEVRGADGWTALTARNEAWDLLVYAIALSLYRPIKIENLDWSNPPPWAEEWDDNELVIWPEEAVKPVKAKTKSLADLSALLA